MLGILTEQGNSCRVAKGKHKRITREANTDTLHGGGFRCSSVEILRKQRRAKDGTGSVFKLNDNCKRDD